MLEAVANTGREIEQSHGERSLSVLREEGKFLLPYLDRSSAWEKMTKDKGIWLKEHVPFLRISAPLQTSSLSMCRKASTPEPGKLNRAIWVN